jgi:hypothetical protein
MTEDERDRRERCFAQPRFQRRQEPCTLLLAYPQTLLGALAVDAALNIEQRVDALNRLQRADRVGSVAL